MRIHTDAVYIDDQQQLAADVFYSGITARHAQLSYAAYRYNHNGDSLLICRKQPQPFDLSGQPARKTVRFNANDGPAYYLPVFYNILRKTGSVPPGSYKIFLILQADSSFLLRQTILQDIDSALTPTSPLRKTLSNTLLPENKARLAGIDLSQQAHTLNNLGRNTARAVDRAAGKIDRLFKARGLTSRVEKRGSKDLICLYYEDWFVGYYELDVNQSLDKQLQQQQQRLTGPVAALATNELGNYRSLISQVKDLVQQKKDDRELKGDISVSGNWSNKQPEYSAQDNNYYEVKGRIETELLDMPVGIEGYYTTQDQHRTIKGSYIRIHYDAEKAKSQLLQLIGGFKNQYAQTRSKGKGLEQVYGSYLASLGGQKDQLIGDMKKETGLTDINTNSLDTAGLRAQITTTLRDKLTDTAALARAADSNGIDSAGRLRRTQASARKLADSADRIYRKNLERYQKLVALEQKARKYYALLEQYRNTSYFDSTFGYDELKDLDHADAMTYKQLATKASALLPEGKVKKFATGLTNLDLGIFPKDVSKYTLAGQQMKGLDVGYDLGFCQVGATYGATEFAGRDGTPDKYTAYSGRLLFTPVKTQKITLVYYGYNPARAMLDKDTFFRNVDMALPSFKKPVHIVSAAYNAVFKKNISVEGELASSFQSGDGTGFKDKVSADRIAWHLNAEGMIPKTMINVQAGYEHGGKDFQNNTLPVNIKGTDRLRLAAKGDFFRSFLTLGVEFNHIRQQSFASEGNNNRWGFEISTHSKRYPSLALSYKPYTTFRSYTDTLAIPQRPLVGAVWTGRASYTLKRQGGRSWRLNAVYNKSTAEIDTSNFGSDMVQVNVIYTTRKWMMMAMAGNTDQQSNVTYADVPAHMRTTFLALSGSYLCGARLSLNAGLDLGVASFGLSRYGGNGGMQYRLKQTPLAVRTMVRYTPYRLSAAGDWNKCLSGSLELSWQFKMKLKNPK